MLKLFSQTWHSVPIVVIDTETTGVVPGTDRAVQIGIVRFEGGKPVGEFVSLVNPGRPIPASATEIHGITDEMVVDASPIAEVFACPDVLRLLDGAQPCAYNSDFDREMVTRFGADPLWPWLDPLTLVRSVDRFVKGPGRHKLETSCARHGVSLIGAHDAAADATAAGKLFYALAPKKFGPETTLGELLKWQRQQDAEEWFRFMEWKAKQPPLPANNGATTEAT